MKGGAHISNIRQVDSERIKDRIKKVLCMAESPYKEEASTARRMAKKMLKAHGWTLADLSEPVVEEVQEALSQSRNLSTKKHAKSSIAVSMRDSAPRKRNGFTEP